MAEGITTRHARSCTAEPCTCRPSYQAHVWSNRDGRRIRKTFPTLAAARSWRTDAKKELQDGTMRAPTTETLRQFADSWLEGAESGTILSRRRTAYAPSTLRGYRHDFETYLYPDFGALRLSDFTRYEAQAVVDGLVAQGWSGSKVHNVLTPLQALYRYAKKRGKVVIDPTDDLELPAVESGREWTGTPEVAAALLAALPKHLRALYGTALYAGLRRGELQALRVSDFQPNGIRVLRSWDAKTGEKLPKSTAGLRTTLLPDTLRTLLELPSDPDALVFGRTATEPFTPSHIRKQAEQAWKGMEPVGLHECRHAFSSFLDAAGVSADRADRYMGHSRPGVASRYRHLLDGQLQEDNARLDSYLTGGATVLDLTRAHAREGTARQLRDNGLSHAAVLSG